MIAVARGDQRALGQLYDQYAGLMLAVARRILGDDREAEDLLHDVMVEAWQKASTFDRARGTVRTWLMLRLRSRALDRRRSARMTKQVLVDDCLTIADKPSGEDPTLSADRTKVRDALMSLPEEQRAVVVPSYFEGLSSSEIAARLGVPIGTVKSRMKAARAKLKAALQQPAMAGVRS